MKNNITKKVKNFVNIHRVFLIALVAVPFFAYIIVFTYRHFQVVSVPATSVQNNSAPSPAVKKGIEQDEKSVGWTPVVFSTNDLSGIKYTKTLLSNGLTEYSFASDTVGRPNILLVKGGMTIFQRTPVYETPFKDDKAFYGKPEYVAKGSVFWGQNALTYIYLLKGVAFTVDPSSSLVLEQMNFQPANVKDFVRFYSVDLIGNIQPYSE